MKIEQLEQVVKIAETNSISLAAEYMFLSQPNLSMSINKLEKEIGFPIFLRTNRGVEVTPLGRTFVDSAKVILMQVKQLSKIGMGTNVGKQEVFSLAHMHYRYVNHAAAKLYNEHQDMNFRMEIYEGVRNDVLSMVEQRMVDIGLIGMFSNYHKITIRQLKARGLQYFRLCSSPVSIILGPGNPFYHTDQTELSIEQIGNFPIVIFNETELEPFTSILDALGMDSQMRRIVVSERSTISDILDKTDAVYITTTSTIAYRNTDYYPNMRHFKLKNCAITGEVGWVKRSDSQPSTTALEFLEILTSYFTVINGALPIPI